MKPEYSLGQITDLVLDFNPNLVPFLSVPSYHRYFRKAKSNRAEAGLLNHAACYLLVLIGIVTLFVMVRTVRESPPPRRKRFQSSSMPIAALTNTTRIF